MEKVAEIVIVGAGIAGLATALGLYRLGKGSLVLESSDSLRVSGFALSTWTNAWKALDALGIGESLRQQHDLLQGILVSSTISGLPTSELSFEGAKGKRENHEVRRVNRKLLIEALGRELPEGTIRYSAKVVSIENCGHLKILHLADGSTLKTKVLIGCDGVNSIVAKWLGFKKPAFTRRSSIRGCAHIKEGHGIGNKFLQFTGEGIRCGFIALDYNTIYWFLTWSDSTKDKEIMESQSKMKEFVLSKLGKVPDQLKELVENTQLDSIVSSPVRMRYPWDLLWGNISKGNVCIAGDAMHPMTPDIGQGGCAALEDGVVLARCLAQAFSTDTEKVTEDDESSRVEMALKKYANERKWRSIKLIITAYIVGHIQESRGLVMTFLKDKILASFLSGLLLKSADFDCGKLSIS